MLACGLDGAVSKTMGEITPRVISPVHRYTLFFLLKKCQRAA